MLSKERGKVLCPVDREVWTHGQPVDETWDFGCTHNAVFDSHMAIFSRHLTFVKIFPGI